MTRVSGGLIDARARAEERRPRDLFRRRRESRRRRPRWSLTAGTATGTELYANHQRKYNQHQRVVVVVVVVVVVLLLRFTLLRTLPRDDPLCVLPATRNVALQRRR